MLRKSCWFSFSTIIYQLTDNLGQLCMTFVLVLYFWTACVPGDCKKIVSTLPYSRDSSSPIGSAPKHHTTTSTSLQVQHNWEYPSQEMIMKERLSSISENKRHELRNVTNISLNKLTPNISIREVSTFGEEGSPNMKEKQIFYRVRKGDPEDYFSHLHEDEVRCDSTVMGNNLGCLQSEIARHLNDLLQMGPIRFSEYIQIVENPEANYQSSFQKRAAGGIETQLWNVVDRFLESRMLKLKFPELFGLIPGFTSITRIHNGRIEISFETTDDSHFEGRGHKKKKKKHKKKKKMKPNEHMQQHHKTMLTILVVKAGMMMKAMMMGAVLVAKKAFLLSMMAFLLSTTTALKKAKKGDANRRYTEIVSGHFYYEPYVYHKHPGHFKKSSASVSLHSGFHPMVTQRPIGYKQVIPDGEQTDWQPIDNPYLGIA